MAMLRRIATATVLVLALAAIFTLLAQTEASDQATVERFLPETEIAEIARLRKVLGATDDPMLIGIRGPEAAGQLDLVEAWLEHAPGVTRSARWQPNDAATSGIVVASLEPNTGQLGHIAELQAWLQNRLARLRPRPEISIVSAGSIRLAVWEGTRRDLRWALPLIVVALVAISLVIYADLTAMFFLLAIAGCTTALTLGLFRCWTGSLTALALLLVPFIWAVATLDAMHVYHRMRRYLDEGLDNMAAIARALRELAKPCALTTLTTAGAMLALATQDESGLMQRFGIWTAIAALLAYALTFGLATEILRSFKPRRAAPHWPERWATELSLAAERHPKPVLLFWLGTLILLGWQLQALRVDVPFPQILVRDHPIHADLDFVQTLTGTDLSPVEIYIDASDTRGRDPLPLLSALGSLNHQLHSYDETVLVLPLDVIDPNEMKIDVGAMRPDLQAEVIRERLQDPRLKTWIHTEAGVARLQVHFAKMTLERKYEILEWIRHFDQTMLSHHRLFFAGPGYAYAEAEWLGWVELWPGSLLPVLVVLVFLVWGFRKRGLWSIAAFANVLPPVLVLGCMAAFDLPWSLAFIPIPAILLGIAVDDSIHLLWPLRHGGTASEAAREAAPALLATTLILMACLLPLGFSSIQTNRWLAGLLSVGLAGALIVDLTLIPAAIRIWWRR